MDAQVSGVNGIYAPGMNIQRTAFGGRNSEYYSEDPVLSGLAAMYEIRGIQSKGIIAYAKHFAFNEQDTHRDGAGVWFNEQAAREIMLRPFEYAVRPSMGNAHAVMSAFIRIGATWVSAHEGLITQILRNEWGFDGFVITDYAGGGLQYMTLLDGIMAGTDCWLLNGEMSFAAFAGSDQAHPLYHFQFLRHYEWNGQRYPCGTGDSLVAGNHLCHGCGFRCAAVGKCCDARDEYEAEKALIRPWAASESVQPRSKGW